jgi:hypothetical protein
MHRLSGGAFLLSVSLVFFSEYLLIFPVFSGF